MRAIIFKEAEKRSSQLGPTAIVIQKVTQELNNPHSSSKSIEKVISVDQALSARVLRMANSAFYGYGGKISTIAQAIVILGLNTLKALLLAAAANRMMNQELKGYGLKEGEFWEHCVLTAVAARELSQRLKYKNHEEVFSSGILHDLGKIFMDTYFHDHRSAVYGLMQDHGLRLDEAEMQVLGVHHGIVGQRIARSWNFPQAFQDVMAHHHNPKLSPQYNQACAIICLSSSMAWQKKHESLSHIPLPPEEEIASAKKILSISDGMYKDIVTLVEAKWKDALYFFD